MKPVHGAHCLYIAQAAFNSRFAQNHWCAFIDINLNSLDFVANRFLVSTLTRHRASTSMFASCCHSNATRASIANPPNSAQLGGIPTTPPSYIRVRAIVWAWGRGQSHTNTDTQTDTHTHTQTRVTTIHFASSTTHAKYNNMHNIEFCRAPFNFVLLGRLIASRRDKFINSDSPLTNLLLPLIYIHLFHHLHVGLRIYCYIHVLFN